MPGKTQRRRSRSIRKREAVEAIRQQYVPAGLSLLSTAEGTTNAFQQYDYLSEAGVGIRGCIFDIGVDKTHPAFHISEVEVGRGLVCMFWTGYPTAGMPQPARPICYIGSLGYRPGRYPKNYWAPPFFSPWQLLAIRNIPPSYLPISKASLLSPAFLTSWCSITASLSALLPMAPSAAIWTPWPPGKGAMMSSDLIKRLRYSNNELRRYISHSSKADLADNLNGQSWHFGLADRSYRPLGRAVQNICIPPPFLVSTPSHNPQPSSCYTLQSSFFSSHNPRPPPASVCGQQTSKTDMGVRSVW